MADMKQAQSAPLDHEEKHEQLTREAFIEVEPAASSTTKPCGRGLIALAQAISCPYLADGPIGPQGSAGQFRCPAPCAQNIIENSQRHFTRWLQRRPGGSFA